MMIRLKKAQSVQEFAILLAVVVAALIAMQVYVKRGMQGRLRDLANQISPRQYESSDTTSTSNITRVGKVTEIENRESFNRTANETTTQDTQEEVASGKKVDTNK